MNFKKFISGVSALTIAASAFAGMAVTANAETGDVIYSNDFTTDTLDTAISSWTASSTKPAGYSYAQIGRGGAFSLVDGRLFFTTSGGKARSTVAHAAYGFFKDEITTATATKDYTMSFDWTAYTNNTAGDNVALELINSDKNVILGLKLNHTRANSSTGANTIDYYVGGSNGFQVCEAGVTKSTNAEGYLGNGTKNNFYSDSNASTTATFNVSLTVSGSTGIGTLTIKGSDNSVLVDGVNVAIDAGKGLDAAYFMARSYDNGAISNMYLDNFSITEAEMDTSDQATYAVKYVDKDNGTEIKTAAQDRVGTIGDSAVITDGDKAAIMYNGQKYIYDSDNAASTTIAAENTVVTVNFRRADTYSYTVNSTLGTVIASGSNFEGNTVTVSYPRYINNNGTLYSKTNSNDYRYSFALNADNTVETLDYTETDIADVVYFSEGENIDGAIATSAGTNMPNRSSNSACGYTTQDVTLVTLQPGTYKITGVVYSQSSTGTTMHFQCGETFDWAVTGASNWKGFDETVEVKTPTELKFLVSGGTQNGLDYIYVQKTAPYAPTAINGTVEEAGNYTTAEGYDEDTKAWKVTFSPAGEVFNTLTITPDGDTSKAQVKNTVNISTTGDVLFGIIASGEYYNSTFTAVASYVE